MITIALVSSSQGFERDQDEIYLKRRLDLTTSQLMY